MALNEKENRFLRHYADVKNPSAAQQQTYNSLQQKVNASKQTTPQPTQKPSAPTNPYAQSEIDRMNRYIKRYTTMSNPNAAHQATYQNIVNTYGANSIKNGQLGVGNFDAKQERAYRAANPLSDYTKDKEMRFLRHIDDGVVNNTGVSDAQMKQYDQLAGKWNFDPTKSRVTNEVTKQIENELALKKKAIEDQLAKAKQSTDLAVQQNNAYLEEQLGKLGQQKVVNDDRAATLSNRRGGFYSGGLDYQLGQNASSYNEASGALQRDVAARNADIQNRNSLLAEQAAEQISLLEQQAPDLIRQRITEELARQQQFALQESQVTGKYKGDPTFEREQWERQKAEWESEQKWNRQWVTEQFAYQKIRDQISDTKWKAEFDESVRQNGLDFALQQMVANNQISMDQARLALSEAELAFNQGKWQAEFGFEQEKWNTELELAKQPQAADLKKYTDQLNKTYLKKTDSGNYKVTNSEGLYRSIVGLNLSDDDTMRLLSMYGIEVGDFLNQ